MTRWLLLFEDRHWPDLRPLADLLPVPALVFGGSHLAYRLRAAVHAATPDLRWLSVEARSTVAAAWRETPAAEVQRPQSQDEVLAVNAATLPGDWLRHGLDGPSPASWTSGDRIVGARLPFATVAPGLGRGAAFEAFLVGLGLPKVAVDARLLRFPLDLVEGNLDALAADLSRLAPGVEGELHPLAAVYEPKRVAIGPDARVDAYAVLDARGGPIRIGAGAVVLSHTVVIGPCAVGEGSRLMGGFVGRSTIGPGCRIAGEVDSSVWQGWSNKGHHGFVGHSAVGEWVNLGALTTTSDLKNTYGPVRVTVGDREVDSGHFKVGSFIGAHAKTGIGTLLPTGASIGVAANLFGGGRYAPKHVPAFGWWDGAAMREHRFEKFVTTAKLAMTRRERPLLPAEEAALKALHDRTRGEWASS